MFIILFLLCLWEQGTPRNFQNKTVNSPFNSVSRYILFLAKLRGKEKPFLEGTRRGTMLWDSPQEHLVVIRDEEVSPFVKFKIILPLHCFLLDTLTNKHCRTWDSMINLWIDSRLKKMFWEKLCCHIDHTLLESSWNGFTKFLN